MDIPAHGPLMVKEAAQVIGCTKSYVYYLVQVGTLRAEKRAGSVYMINRSDVTRFAKKRALIRKGKEAMLA